MIIKGFFSFYYFLFILGASLYLNLNSLKKIEIFFLSSIIYSLSLSWFFIYFINIFDLNFDFKILLIFFCISMFTIYFNRQNKNEINSKELFNFLIFFFVLFIIFFSILLIKYVPVFVHGDAVFQWNGRWSLLLYLNEFKSNGTYPVFWPGLWALIYKAESSFDNWIIPSLTQFILPVMLIITSYIFFKKNKILFLYNLFFIIVFFWTFKRTALVGYMDTPIAILYLIFFQLFLIYLFEKRDRSYLLLLSLIAGISAITKQVGFLLPFISTLFLFIIYTDRKISFINFLILSIIPFIFLISFLSFDKIYNPFTFFYDLILNSDKLETNFSHLQSEAQKSHLDSLNVIFESFNKFFLFFILITSLFNFINFKNKICIFGMIIFLFSIISFYFFSKYGSYDERNGRFIITMIFSSSFFYMFSKFPSTDGFKLINFKDKSLRFNKIIFLSAIIILFLSIIFSKIINFREIQQEIQSMLGTIQYSDKTKKEIPMKINELILKSPKCSKVFIDEHILAYNLKLINYYNLDKNKSKIQVYNYPEEFLQNTSFESCDGPIIWYFKNEKSIEKLKINELKNLKVNKLNKYLYLIYQK